MVGVVFLLVLERYFIVKGLLAPFYRLDMCLKSTFIITRMNYSHEYQSEKRDKSVACRRCI